MKKSELETLIETIVRDKLNEASTIDPDQKDYQRIKDLISLSTSDFEKGFKATQKQVNSITDGAKAFRRGKAADELGYSGIANMFYKKANELGYKTNKNADFKTIPNKPDVKGFIYLPTDSAMGLYEWEITGQLSDGAWENTRPYNHWEPWSNLMVKKGTPEVKANMYFPKTSYNLLSLLQYIEERMINFGRFAKANGYNEKYDANHWEIEKLPATKQEYDKKPIQLKGISKSEIDKFYNTEYTRSNLINDLKSIKNAMSTAKKW